jgi:signal transduction histidine kinase
MDWVKDAVLWFSGGARQYLPSVHCMNHDWFWVYLTILTSGGIIVGYTLIALKWRTSEQLVSQTVVKRILSDLRNIFIWCAICGYGFNIVRMWWPAWRLLDFAQIVLLVYTFRYVLRSRGMRAVYEELGRVEKLEGDLNRITAEDKKRRFFMNALSHDLRSPLNSSVLSADLARMAIETGQRELALEAVETIKENTAAATDLLNKLLDYTRVSTDWENRPTEVLVSNLLHGATRRHETAAAAKGVSFEARCTGDGVAVVDVSKTERIISNLVENAIKFTAQGAVRVEAGLDGGTLSVRVTDSGPGISPEDQSLLFSEFFQVGNYERDRHKGFGMGLAISRVLARQMDGDVLLAHTDGRGSTFDCRLPVVVPARASEGDGGRGRPRRVPGHHAAAAT